MNATTTHIEKHSSSLRGTKPSQQLARPEQGRRVPTLRFKEFDGELTNCKLDDIVTFKSGGTPSKEKDTYWNGDIPWISAASMLGKYYSKSERTITEEGLKSGSKLALKGSLLLLVRGSMLFNKIPIGIAERDVAFNQDLKTLIPNEKSYNEFLYQWFSAKQNYLLHKVTGTGIGAGKLDTDDLKSLKLVLPSLPEQQKIASFLSAVDEKIQQLSKKKALLEQYKKGVMQQLFSQQLRFKPDTSTPLSAGNGNLAAERSRSYPDWEEKRLGAVATFLDGRRKPIKSGDRSKMQGEYPYYGASGIIDYVNNYIFDEEIILLGEDGENIISRNLPLAFRVSGKCWINNHAHVIKPNDNIDIDFLTFSLERINYEPYNTGTAQPKLNQAVCRSLPLNLPSYPEQQKIATYLSAIDTKIESVASARSATEQFKKGLLQQMFV